MTTIPKNIESLDGGASFVRADLHFHSYGDDGSYDVKDVTMTPQAIVDSAITNGISIIAIADHHKTGNSKTAIAYAKGKNVLVLPAVELSTNEGHLVVYAETIERIEAIVSNLEFSADRKSCKSTMKQAIDRVVTQGGFAIAAHINTEKGFERVISGYGDPKRDILEHPGLLGIEVSVKEELSMFTNEDDLESRRAFATQSVGTRGFSVGDRARIMSSDAHTMSRLWKNPSDEERITRIKVNELSFAAVHTALLDPTARVKVEDEIPKTIPYFAGVSFKGGFLDGQYVRFNKNLNAIIGGRGSGKSTLLESVKVTSGNTSKNINEFRLLDGDVWSDEIILYYEDEVGNVTEFKRPKGRPLINVTDPDNGLSSVPIESYGQGDLMKMIANSATEPDVLTAFLDGFVDFGELKDLDEQARADLISNNGSIRELEAELQQLPRYRELFTVAKQKLDSMKKQKVSELVELEQALAEEKSLRVDIKNEVDERKAIVRDGLQEAEELTIDNLVDGKKIKAGQDELDRIKVLITEYTKIVKATSVDFSGKTEVILSEIDEKIDEWVKKEAVLLGKIEIKKNELISQGITPDLIGIKSVTNDYVTYQKKIVDLEKKKIELGNLEKVRTTLLKKRDQHKRDIYAKRYSFATEVNSQFTDTIDYDVKVEYKQGLHSPALADTIQRVMDWRTSQVPRATLIAEYMTPSEFLAAVRARNTSAFGAIKDKDGNKALTALDVAGIIREFGLLHKDRQRDIEELAFEDRPSITVSKDVDDGNGGMKRISRSFYKLSFGQQQAICLTILLNSGQNIPLLIDQPEDNLDSEFIYKTLVATLRRVKEKRQVIVVTHDANIAVLGDAELIIPLRSTNERAVVTDRGSIDKQDTKNITCKILEGGEAAFLRRQEMYNI